MKKATYSHYYRFDLTRQYESRFAAFMGLAGLEYHGAPIEGVSPMRRKADGRAYGTDTFTLRTYCWDEDPEESGKPNFEYHPDGKMPTRLRMKWYKYPLRDQQSDTNLTVRQFSRMLDDCLRSLGITESVEDHLPEDTAA